MSKLSTKKREQLLLLTEKRRRTEWAGYRGIASYHDGVYDCPYVSPYTKSASNVDADVFVLLQDWASDKLLRQPVDPDIVWLGHKPGLPTNRNLIRLLGEVLNLSLCEVYATNLFPFVKPGGMSTKIPREILQDAAREFAVPQIKFVKPKLVICLGLSVFQSMQAEYRQTPSINMESAVKAHFTAEGIQFWFQAHTGSRGQVTRNGDDSKRVIRDWTRMARLSGVP